MRATRTRKKTRHEPRFELPDDKKLTYEMVIRSLGATCDACARPAQDVLPVLRNHQPRGALQGGRPTIARATGRSSQRVLNHRQLSFQGAVLAHTKSSIPGRHSSENYIPLRNADDPGRDLRVGAARRTCGGNYEQQKSVPLPYWCDRDHGDIKGECHALLPAPRQPRSRSDPLHIRMKSASACSDRRGIGGKHGRVSSTSTSTPSVDSFSERPSSEGRPTAHS